MPSSGMMTSDVIFVARVRPTNRPAHAGARQSSGRLRARRKSTIVADAMTSAIESLLTAPPTRLLTTVTRAAPSSQIAGWAGKSRRASSHVSGITVNPSSTVARRTTYTLPRSPPITRPAQ
jgi:hypothetical protein